MDAGSCLVPDCSELAPHHSRYRLTTTALINGPFIGAFIGPLFPRQLRYPPDRMLPRGGLAQDKAEPFQMMMRVYWSVKIAQYAAA